MYSEYEGTIMYRLGEWRNYAPGCDLAHEEGRLSRSACRPAKAVGKPSRAKFGRLFGAQGANVRDLGGEAVPGHSHSHYIPPQSLRLLGDD